MLMRPRGKSLLSPLYAAVCLLFATEAVAQAPERYTFAVVPQYSATELYKDWAPLLQRISRDSGVPLDLKIAASIPKFESEFSKGIPDFAYLNPYHAVMAKRSHGYVPILRDSKPLSGILVVRQDSPYKSASELNGKTIAFPAPNAFGASLFMRALLSESVGIKFDTRYLSTHPNVFRHVIRGEAAAGGSVGAAFNDELPQVREQLRIIYKTPEVSSHPVSVHPRVPESVRRAVAQAFLALAKDDAGRALLKDIRTPQPVEAEYVRDYSPLEKLNIQKYVVIEKE